MSVRQRKGVRRYSDHPFTLSGFLPSNACMGVDKHQQLKQEGKTAHRTTHPWLKPALLEVVRPLVGIMDQAFQLELSSPLSGPAGKEKGL